MVVAEEVAFPHRDTRVYAEDTDLLRLNPLRFQDMDKMICTGSSSLCLPSVGSCHVSQDLGLKLRWVSLDPILKKKKNQKRK